MTETALEVRGLGVAYGERRALEDVTVEQPPGTLVGVVGPNGGGKSTLVKAVLDLVRPYKGEVDVSGRQLDRRERRLVGYVPQRDDVDRSFPVNALDVVLMDRIPSLRPFRRYGENDRRLAREALHTVRLADRAVSASGNSPAASSSGSFWRAR